RERHRAKDMAALGATMAAMPSAYEAAVAGYNFAMTAQAANARDDRLAVKMPTAQAKKYETMARKRVQQAMIPLVRDIFGNPFQTQPVIAPEILQWQNGIVVKLAEAIYDQRAFDRMPILGDCLEDAGCQDATTL